MMFILKFLGALLILTSEVPGLTIDYADLFFTNSKDLSSNQKLIWSYKDLKLIGSTQTKLIKENNEPIIMASITDDRSWQLIKSKFNIVRVIDYDDIRFALIKITSEKSWTDLAMIVHDHNNFSCGKLQLIDESFRLRTTSTLKNLSYKPSKKIDSLVSLFAEVAQSNILNTIQTLEDIGTRYHSTSEGLSTPTAISNIIKSLPGYGQNYTVTMFDHENTNQNSVIVKFTGSEKPEEIVVLGAHLDSINSRNGNEHAPGADDDASGVASLIEIIRIFGKNNIKFKKSVEFQFYAAEEIGLVGSGEIAKDYATQSKIVVSMMQFDMNAWSFEKDQPIYLVENDTTYTLNQYVADLINTYEIADVAFGSLPSGATSDHRSFNQSGFHTTFPFENPSEYNPNIHTELDTRENLNSPDLSVKFSKLGLAFVVHAGGSPNYDETYLSAPENTTKDLFIHLSESTNNQGLYDFYISTQENIKKVSFCSIASSDDGICSTEAITSTSAISKEGRKIFKATDSLNLSTPLTLRVTGINENNQTEFERNLSISE